MRRALLVLIACLGISLALTGDASVNRTQTGDYIISSDHMSLNTLPAGTGTLLQKNIDIVAGTGTKITYDTKGLILGSEAASLSDLGDVQFGSLAADQHLIFNGLKWANQMFFDVSGNRQTPIRQQAGSAISFTAGANRLSAFLCGSNNGSACNAAVTMSASPPIQAGTLVGKQDLTLCGTDSTNTVRINTSVNTVLNGDAILGKDDCLNLLWGGTDGSNAAWI
jgi:hypothetical protein